MQKLTRRRERFEGQTVGLDHHKRMIQFSWLDETGEEIANEAMAATPEAVRAVLGRVWARGPVQVAVEATGSFLWLHDLLVELLGRSRVHVAAPSRLRVIAQASDKDDQKDAWWLAYLLWDGRLPTAFVAEGQLRELRVACRERRALTEERADLKRRMKSHLAQLGRSFRGSDWHSALGWQRIDAMVASVSDRGLLGQAIARLWMRIKELTEEMAYWEDQVAALSQDIEPVRQLQSRMCGLGAVLAPVVWSEMGSPSRFTCAKAYARGTGVTPGYRRSAGKTRRRCITREGNAHVRWALTRAVVATLRATRGPGLAIRRWVEARSRRLGKKAAIVAAARKLAESIWRLFHLGKDFDLAKAFTT
jgi:transposase